MAAEVKAIKQIPLVLKPADPYAEKYFVLHSGVATAVEQANAAISQQLAQPSSFNLLCFFGRQGIGKSHLLSYLHAQAMAQRIPEDKIKLYELAVGEEQSDAVQAFISGYNNQLAQGGLAFVALDQSEIFDDLSPHLLSRLKRGNCVLLEPPQEQEILPVLRSLLERNNLQLTEHALEYLMRRVARDPLSFNDIFARISHLSLMESRPAGLAVVRRVIEAPS